MSHKLPDDIQQPAKNIQSLQKPAANPTHRRRKEQKLTLGPRITSREGEALQYSDPEPIWWDRFIPEPLKTRRTSQKWKEPIPVTINLPEHVSDQAVEPALSNFGEVVSVFKGRHKFNRKLRNGKRHVRIFPAGGILQYCRGKFLSSVAPARMSSSRKQWCDAIDAKLAICSVRIAPWLCPLRKDLTCLTLSRARPLRIPPPLGPSKNPELMRRGAMSLLRRGRLVVAPVQGCLPSLTKEMALSGCLLCQMICHRGWLSLLLQELQLIQMKLTRSQSKVSKLWETLISHASTDNWTEKRLLRTFWRKVNFR